MSTNPCHFLRGGARFLTSNRPFDVGDEPAHDSNSVHDSNPGILNGNFTTAR